MRQRGHVVRALVLCGVLVIGLTALLERSHAPSRTPYLLPQLLTTWTRHPRLFVGRTVSVTGGIATVCDGADPTSTAGACPGVLRYVFEDEHTLRSLTSTTPPGSLQVRFDPSTLPMWLRHVPLLGDVARQLLTYHGSGMGIYQLHILRTTPCPPFEPTGIPEQPRCIDAAVGGGPS